MDDLDVKVPFVLDFLCQQLLDVLIALVSLIVVFPYLLVFVAILLVIFVVIFTAFKPAMRELKRLESISRFVSPNAGLEPRFSVSSSFRPD